VLLLAASIYIKVRIHNHFAAERNAISSDIHEARRHVRISEPEVKVVAEINAVGWGCSPLTRMEDGEDEISAYPNDRHFEVELNFYFSNSKLTEITGEVDEEEDYFIPTNWRK
jgi:hypothetical protein